MARRMRHPLFFSKVTGDYSEGWGHVVDQSRSWEDAYRDRWAHDKIVRSTHGVNCTGSCSWELYVKDGIITWEYQAHDYPPTPAGVPNHEPRGCPRGASFSWYLYSATRIKHPLIRAELQKAWRKARESYDPVTAWQSIVERTDIRDSYTTARGLGGFVRTTWDEATDIMAAANMYTIRRYGPDRICGFTPIPGYSMVSYGAGTRYLSLLGGTTLSFYDWYCDLPPSSPQTWGEQTDVPESSAWYYSTYIIVWGTNISMTRTPDAHFLTEARYNGAKVVNLCPDYCEVTKDADWWLHPRQSTDAALALAMAHVIMKEFHVDHADPYFTDYVKRFTDLPMLVMLDPCSLRESQDEEVDVSDTASPSTDNEAGSSSNDDMQTFQAGRTLRASDVPRFGTISNAEWKTAVWDSISQRVAFPNGSIGYRWTEDGKPEQGKWNLEQQDGESGETLDAALSLISVADDVVDVAFPYFGGIANPEASTGSDSGKNDYGTLHRRVPVKQLALKQGLTYVTTVFDLLAAYLGIDRGLGGEAATGYDDPIPFTPAWQESITGVSADDAITLAREFASAASASHGRACVCMGAGVNQWFQTDNTYRAIIFLLLLCGTCGVPGGGWCHYVGQEKIRPEAGWSEFSFAKDWVPTTRQMNATSFFYEHTDQWRYERIPLSYMLSPLADKQNYTGTYLDYNVISEMLGWLPTSPQLNKNPTLLAVKAKASNRSTIDYTIDELEQGSLRFSAQDPDDPENWPRNMFIWRSNLLGSSGKGQEYFLRHLLGTQDGILGEELTDKEAALRPELVPWRKAPIGKLDLLVDMDFRMSTTAVYSDIVLPACTFYEKNDINTTDMHSFIHPFVKAVSCVWEGRSEWEIFGLLSEKIAAIARKDPKTYGKVEDVVLSPLGHDSSHELGQPLEVKRWFRGECDYIPGKTAPNITVVERDYRAIHDQYCSVGPRLSQPQGGGNRGITWDLTPEITELGDLNGWVHEGPAARRPRLDSDIDAANFILRVSPETNGSLAYRSWDFVENQTGMPCKHVSFEHQGTKLTFDDLTNRPQLTFTAPDWSGTETDTIPYVAFWQNVNLKLPWRTLTGRQHFYQDHQWMRDFGQAFPQYRGQADQGVLEGFKDLKPNGNKILSLNFMTVHQKWGIHSTYFDNERMLALSRGGPIIWINNTDAKEASINDNDWVELWNGNGAVTARAVVSSRLPQGLSIMQHATEKIINTPGSEITGLRGGDHNSPTRVVINPTHMIGGYAQLSYAFNYYGTISPNRDDHVWLRKMDRIDWMEEQADE